VALLVDSATFMAALIAMALMSAGAIERAAEARPARKASVLHEAREAIGFVRTTPWIWAGILAAAVANISLTGPLQVLTPYVVKYTLHGGVRDLALVIAGGGPLRSDLERHVRQLGLEGRVVFEELLATFPTIELSGEPTRVRSNLNNGFKRLPVRMTRA